MPLYYQYRKIDRIADQVIQRYPQAPTSRRVLRALEKDIPLLLPQGSSSRSGARGGELPERVIALIEKLPPITQYINQGFIATETAIPLFLNAERHYVSEHKSQMGITPDAGQARYRSD